MTKRYRGRRHQEGRAKQLCRLSSSAGAAVVAARQPLEVSKKHGKIFEDLEEFHVLHFSSLWRFHLISSFSPHGAAPSSRGTARCEGRWPVREAVHRCRRRCRRLQQLQQLGLRFAKNSVNHWHDRSVATWRKSSWNLSWTLSAEDFEPVSLLTLYIPVSALVHSGLIPIKSFSQPVQPAIIPQGSLPKVSEKQRSKIVAKKNKGSQAAKGPSQPCLPCSTCRQCSMLHGISILTIPSSQQTTQAYPQRKQQ